MARLVLTIGFVCLLIVPQPIFAEVANTDYLDVIGGFEHSRLVRWFSTYSRRGYDFAANSIYVDPSDSGNHTSRMGYSIPTVDSEVGDGWIKSTGADVDPWTNAVYRIVSPSDFSGSKCQYMGLRGTTAVKAVASIDHHVDVDSTKAAALHVGDTVTFTIDHIRMSDYSDLPAGASVRYGMALAGLSASRELQPSPVDSSASVTGVVPKGVRQVVVSVYVATSGDIGTKTPGIYVDGAHLYVKRAGQVSFEQREIPVVRPRRIVTQTVQFHPSTCDIYTAARDNDSLTESESEAGSLELLRAYNPAMQVYVYQSGATCIDSRDADGRERVFRDAALTYVEGMRDHPEWLYADGSGGFRRGSDYVDRHQLRISDPSFQKFWIDQTIKKAKRYGYDGVWIDDLSALRPDKFDGITRTLSEVQQFIHAVCPKLKAAGLKVVQNECAMHLDGSADWTGNVGKIYSDPFWTPDAEHPSTSGYSANTPSTVPDVIFQEYAFLVPRELANGYDGSYWLACLWDMDEVARWNTAVDSAGKPRLDAKEKRQLAMWVLGRDFANDAAYGADGWINFGLCSYLLGQNEWTSVGFRIEKGAGAAAQPCPDVDYSITKRLGVPAAPHQPCGTDPYFRYRRYRPTTDGGLGGVVVVNANPDAPRTYTLDIDAVDADGHSYPAGTKIVLKPHAGRIFIAGKQAQQK